MYSVVLPALLFTLATSGICFLMNRERFLMDWEATFTHPLARLVLNLSFFSQAWGRNTIPFTNAPFWSLGYECIYYLFYGFFFYLRGWVRIFLCVLLGLAIGPQVLFLLPVWWLGCWMYDLYVHRRRGYLASGVMLSVVVWLVVSGAVSLFGYSSRLTPWAIFYCISHLPNPLGLLGVSYLRANMFAVAVGLFSALALFVSLLAMDSLEISRSSRLAKGFRAVANGTFTIYLMHFPFLLLLSYTHVLRPGRIWSNNVVVSLMCAALAAVAVPVDAFKLAIRRYLSRIMQV